MAYISLYLHYYNHYCFLLKIYFTFGVGQHTFNINNIELLIIADDFADVLSRAKDVGVEKV